jgi:hypothetical protein
VSLTAVIRVKQSNGVIVSAYAGQPIIKVVPSPTFTVVQSQASEGPSISSVVQSYQQIIIPGQSTTPTLTNQAISDLSNYSNTEVVLGFVNTAYSNSIAFVEANYTNSASLQLSSLNDVSANTRANNDTLVFDTMQNKYISKQLDLDGGNF